MKTGSGDELWSAIADPSRRRGLTRFTQAWRSRASDHLFVRCVRSPPSHGPRGRARRASHQAVPGSATMNTVPSSSSTPGSRVTGSEKWN